MPEIREDNGVVTQITTVKVPPDNQAEVLELMKERARFMASQPGFVSVSLHRSEDGSHVVNYVQWRNREQLKAAHHSPEFRKKWPRFGELIKEASTDTSKALKNAHSKVEEQEDEHLYHTQGWCRELWIQFLGMKAVLPPPEETKDVKTAIGAARAKQARAKSA